MLFLEISMIYFTPLHVTSSLAFQILCATNWGIFLFFSWPTWMSLIYLSDQEKRLISIASSRTSCSEEKKNIIIIIGNILCPSSHCWFNLSFSLCVTQASAQFYLSWIPVLQLQWSVLLWKYWLLQLLNIIITYWNNLQSYPWKTHAASLRKHCSPTAQQMKKFPFVHPVS